MPASSATAADASAGRAAQRLLVLGAVLVVLAAAPFPYFDLDRHSVPKELVLHLTAFGAAIVCLARARRLPVTAVDLLLGGFLVASAVSLAGAENPWLALRALGVSLAGALVFWTARAVRAAGRGRALVAGLVAAAVLGTLTGLAQAYGLELPVITDLTSLSRAPGGTFGNRNFLAHLAVIAFPALVDVTLRARKGRGALVGVIATGALTAALVLTRSRAAWLGFAVAGTLLAVELFATGRLQAKRARRRRALASVVAVVVGAALALALPNRLRWKSDNPYAESLTGVANFQEGSGHGRLIQWRNTLRMVEDHPLLGVGPGNWAVAYPLYTTPGDPAWDTGSLMPTNPWPSSDWVAFLAERGALGFLALLLAGGVLIARGWRVAHPGRYGQERRRGGGGGASAPSGDDLALDGLAVVATLVATIVVGAFDAVLLLPVPALFVWGLVGALAPEGRPLGALALGTVTRRALLAGAWACGLVLAARSASQFAAMTVYTHARRAGTLERASMLDPGSYRIHILLAVTWRNRGRCDRARPHAEAARTLFPHTPAPRTVLRACGVRPARTARARRTT